MDGVACQMGVARRRLKFAVAEELPDHRQGLPECERARSEAVSEVVNSPLFQPGAPTDGPPRMLKADRC